MKRKTVPRRWWVYLLLFLLVTINYMDRTALSVAITPIERELGLSPSEAGWILSSFLWTYLIVLIPMGIVTDRLGTRVTNALSIVVWSLATAMMAAVRGFGSIIGARLLMGIGEAPTYPASAKVVREWAPQSERGRVTAIYNSGAYAGPAIGAVVAAALITAFSWRAMFVIMGIVGFVWLAAWLVWFRDPAKARWLSSEEREQILAERVRSDQSVDAPLKGGVLGLLRYRSMWGIALVQSAAVYSQYLFLTWLPGYLEQVHHLSVLSSGWFTAVPYIVAVVVGIAAGIAIDKGITQKAAAAGTRRFIVAASMLVSAVVLLTPFVGNVVAIIVLVSVSLTAISTAVSMNLALLSDLLHSSRLAGRAQSIAMVGGNIFGALAPIVTGYIVQATGSYNSAFVVAGALLLAGVAMALTLPRGPIGDTQDRAGAPSIAARLAA